MIISSIDIGTNTVLLLITEVDLSKETFKPLRNEISMPRIGKGLKRGGNISKEKIDLLMQTLSDYHSMIKNSGSEKVLISGTNALRIAANSDEISKRVNGLLGWNINIISGDEEAEYAYLGASSLFKPKETNLVIDIGGGSTELILGNEKSIMFKQSFQIGSVSATEKYLMNSPPTSDQISSLNDALNKIFSANKLQFKVDNAIAVAGTPTTLGCIHLNLKEFDENIVEGSKINLITLYKMERELSKLASKQILNNYGKVLNGREDIIFAGAKILSTILSRFNIEEVTISSRGIRHGAIIKYINTLKDEHS